MRALGFGMIFPKAQKVEFDYSKYLGKWYEVPAKYNTIVSNH